MKLSRIALAALALAAPAAFGCSADTTTSIDPSQTAEVGGIEMALRLPGGTTLDSIDYAITNANGYDNSGEVPLQNSTLVRFQIGNIPAATGYALSLSGTTSDGRSCTSTPVSFAIQAGQTTAIQTTLRCAGADASSGNGNVSVDVGVVDEPTCPQVDGLTALPLEVLVGFSISLRGYATLPNATFGWTVAPATAGTFSAPAAAATAFTCVQEGDHVVTLGVSAPGCTAVTTTVSVTCTDDGVPPPVPVCGNGLVEGTETCDDGNVLAGDGCSAACTIELAPAPVCGNGVLETGEACDDGNTTAGDGCSATCTIEVPPPAPVCGNGVLETGEACDDGNTTAGDGCSATCTIEVPPPAPVCGNGVLETGEACDDGNTTAGDGCSPTCTIVPVGPTCESCRQANCTNFQGVDLVAGCFAAVNGDFGADAADPNFIQQCVNVISCARQNDCAYSVDKQAAGCYCGSASIDQCAATGPAADAPCVAQWQAAARSTVNAEIQVRFTDLAYPTGWAYFLLDCDRTSCNSASTGDCTAP